MIAALCTAAACAIRPMIFKNIVETVCLQGAAVSASDISDSMADEARRRYEAALAEGGTAPSTAPTFEGTDLESLHGKWDTVSCLDVLIHYDQVAEAFAIQASWFLHVAYACIYAQRYKGKNL